MFEFPKVVKAHTLGEVGISGTVLLSVYYGTTFQFLLKLVCLADEEQRISWHSFFFLRHGVQLTPKPRFLEKMNRNRTQTEKKTFCAPLPY